MARSIALPFPDHAGHTISIADHGASGGSALRDTAAINAAIMTANAAGGGLVIVPPGRFRCFSLRLCSNVTLLLEDGAVIEAADPALHGGTYDWPEDNGDQLYQDFGHSHWRNSLLSGIGLCRIAIIGHGTIDGRGLTRHGPGSRWRQQAGERPLSMAAMSDADIATLEPDAAAMRGLGNKAIGLRDCRDVHLEGLTLDRGGHFAVLASGVQDLVIKSLAIDSERDGIDLDCVTRARIENCRINTPNDDAITIKASLALGQRLPSQDITITGCKVSGFDRGTLINGTRKREQQFAPDRDRVTGRIKIGTESNGDFRNIRINDCRFERSRGLAIETVDGGTIEDISASGLTMDEVTTAPLFLRLGDRRRGPEGTGIGALRGVTICDVEARGIDHRFCASIAGLPGHRIENVTLRDITLRYAGGGSAEQAHIQPPELAEAYPEPSMFGPLPAWALWARHVRGLTLERFAASTETPDFRPPLIFDDVAEKSLSGIAIPALGD